MYLIKVLIQLSEMEKMNQVFASFGDVQISDRGLIWNTDLVETLENNNCPIDSLRVSGGQGRSSVWNQMKADITGRRLLIPETEDAELAGCACCASAALGRHKTALEAVKTYSRIRYIIEPLPANVLLYNEAYSRYRDSAAELLKQ